MAARRDLGSGGRWESEPPSRGSRRSARSLPTPPWACGGLCATLARGGCVRRAACRDVLARSWLEVAFGRPWSDWDDSKTWLAAVTAPETHMRVPEHAEVAERIAVLRAAKNVVCARMPGVCAPRRNGRVRGTRATLNVRTSSEKALNTSSGTVCNSVRA